MEPPGGDPHEIEAAPSSVGNSAAANGQNFEPSDAVEVRAVSALAVTSSPRLHRAESMPMTV